MSHLEPQELSNLITNSKKKVEVGGKYFHYKHPDKFYTVLRIGFIESTEEVSVIYEAQYGEKLVWVRTVEDFTTKVKLENGSEVDRFTKVG